MGAGQKDVMLSHDVYQKLGASHSHEQPTSLILRPRRLFRFCDFADLIVCSVHKFVATDLSGGS